MTRRLKEKDWIDICWHECKSMWRYVSRNNKSYLSVSACKKEWLKANGYENCYMICDCFFCHYMCTHPESSPDNTCISCPGKAIDEDFKCTNDNYHYKYLPKEFYEKIVELDKERKEQS